MNKVSNKNLNSEHKDMKRLVVGLLLVIFVMLIIIVIALLKDGGSFRGVIINPSSLIDPLRQFYKADDLVINMQPLRDEFNMLEKNPNVSVYFEALNTGANISINKDMEFFPSSLLKVPLIIAITKKIERGDWKWSTKIELAEADKNKDFGKLWQEPTGARFTIEELARQLLTKSDNTAYFMLLNNLDPQELVKAQEHLGLYDFISDNLEISAKKYAPVLRSLFSATYLNIENSEKILEWMSESDFNNYLASGLPTAVRFSHKIGVQEEKNIYLDAGIVYLPNRPYMLIVMIKNLSSDKVDAIMRDISQKAFNYMKDYPKNI